MCEEIIEMLKNVNEDFDGDADMDLFDAEIIDSFEIIKLVMQLEEKFGVVIGVEMVTAENFRTVNSIANLVRELS